MQKQTDEKQEEKGKITHSPSALIAVRPNRPKCVATHSSTKTKKGTIRESKRIKKGKIGKPHKNTQTNNQTRRNNIKKRTARAP